MSLLSSQRAGASAPRSWCMLLVLVSGSALGCAPDGQESDTQEADEVSVDEASADESTGEYLESRRGNAWGWWRRRDGGFPFPGFPGFPRRDAGIVRDAGGELPTDAGMVPSDAGVETPTDAGGETPTDAGGPVPTDAGNPGTPGAAPRIPPRPAQCPEIRTGTITVLGQRVELQVGAKQPGKRGPILFYWHGTGSSAAEVRGGLGEGTQEILAEGGVIASFTTTTRQGQNTGNNVWYTGDFAMADQILACAVEQQDVDPRRVYTAGCSAGGLQASAMVYARSSYLAAAMPNSGGTVFRYQLEDPSHVPAFIGAHGSRDVVVINFAETTTNQTRDLAAKGGFAVQCDHGGGHCASPTALKNAQWRFLKDHPFGVAPEPYAGGLPAGFPSYCRIVTAP